MTQDEKKNQARQLKGSALLEEILAGADAAAIAKWRTSTSPQKREECWHSVQAVATIRRTISNAIEALLK